MSNLNNKEKQFQDILKEIEYDLDTSMVWADIKDQLPLKKEDKKSPFWLFLGLGISLLTMTSFVTYTYLNNSDTIELVEQIEFKSISQAIISQKQNISNNEIQSNFSNSSNNQINIESNLAQVSSSGSSAVSIENKSFENEIALIRKETSLRNNAIVNQVNNSTTIGNRVGVNKSESKNVITNSIKENDISSVTTLNILDVKQIPSLNNLLKSNTGFAINAPDNYSAIIEPVSMPKQFQYFVSTRSGINYGFAQNELSSQSDFNADKFEREKARIGYSHDLLVGVENIQGWTFGVGVSYNSQFYNYKNQSIESYVTQEPGITSNHINADGSLTTNNGEVNVTNTSTYDLSWNRRHKFVDVQVMIGKRLLNFNRFSLIGEVDVAHNIYSNHSGYFFEEGTGDIAKFVSADDNPYVNNNKFSAGAGIGIDYNFNQFSIGLKSSYRYNPNNLLQEDNFYKTKNNFTKLQLNLTYFPSR